jgi:Pvc16 N-terminal domain
VIQFIDEAIERLLRRQVPLPEGTVDLSFAAPDRAWSAGITRPTVNVFLWDIRRNTVRSTGGLAEQAVNGQVVRRPSSPVVDLRYLVTAWAAEHRDEHQLLGAVLVCVLATTSVPEDDLPAELPRTSPVSLSLASEEARVPGEFWSSLDGRLKPGLQMVVSLPLEILSWVPAGPPVASVSVAHQHLAKAPAPKPAGSPTYGKRGKAVEDGRLLRRRRSSGLLTMEGRPASSAPAGAVDGTAPADDQGDNQEP